MLLTFKIISFKQNITYFEGIILKHFFLNIYFSIKFFFDNFEENTKEFRNKR